MGGQGGRWWGNSVDPDQMILSFPTDKFFRQTGENNIDPDQIILSFLTDRGETL